ncbi:ribonuclease H-like domain-containing protein [Tanacetum coccineum]
MTNDNPPLTPALTLNGIKPQVFESNFNYLLLQNNFDVDAMNYSSWVYYFSHLCHGYGILDHLVDPVASSSTTTPTDPPPKDAEWTKIDFIIRSWIFSTLAPSLRKRLVDLNPTTAKDAWTYIEAIFQDNKRPRAMALKAELRNLKLGDLSIDGYFQKIESIVSVLNGLGSPLSNDDVVTFALEGLPSTYETISTVIVSREPFPDLKMVRSLLTTHEMRLKSRVQNPLVDATSASPMVLLAKSNTSARRGPSLEKVNNPCWSFAKGSCRFGDACKYLHNGVHGKSTLLPRTSGSASSVSGVTRSDLDMLQSLLAKFGLNALNISTPSPPVAYTGNGWVIPTSVQYPTGSPQQGVHYLQQGVQTLSGPPQRVHLVPGTSQPLVQFTTRVQQQQGGSFPGSVHLGQSPSMPFHPSQLFASGSQGSGQATLLPNAFNTTTLQEPASGNWNMDTGASSHLNDFLIDFITRRVLLRCDSTGELYPVTKPSTIPHAFLTSQYTWHQRLGYPGSEVLRRLVSSDSISCNKEKLPVLCHACQLGKHVKLPFVSSSSSVTSCFDIVHSDLWTSPIPSLSGFQYYVLFLDHYSVSRLIVPRPEGANIVRCMWLFRHKFLADGTLSRYKARLVANGSMQVEGVDVDETFSLVVKPGTIWTVLSLAISRHWHVHQLDVKNAFLHGDLAETVYMHQPPGFRDPEHPDYVCLLQRSLYGLKQAPRAWFRDQIISLFTSEFSMTDLGALNYFLGISVTRDSSGMFLSQRKYAMEILERAHMVGCNSSRTPVDTESKLGDGGTPVVDPTLYRSLAGSLQYLTFTRPDITYAVQQVCLYMHDPREPHFSALKRILRYVQGTLDYGLQLFSSTTDSLIAYSDADWAGCPTTRRSTSGYCVFLGNNLLSWSSKRQPTLSRSSAEAEYRGVANAVAETCWIRNLLRELHTPLSSATIVYCDNVSAVYLSSNLVQHQRTKHIEIDIHFVRDLVATGQVCVLHVPSRFQYANIFTKGLPPALFEEFRTSLSVGCPPAPTAGEC